MKTKETAIVLPSKEKMLSRLLKENDSKDMRENFYPFLLDHAEENRTISGMVIWIMAAIDDYCTERDPAIKKIVYKQMLGFIDILVDEKAEAKELKELLEEVRRVEGG